MEVIDDDNDTYQIYHYEHVERVLTMWEFNCKFSKVQVWEHVTILLHT